jgi:hypothetical protein
MSTTYRKPTAKRAATARETIARRARVQRPSLLDHLLDGFWSMSKVPANVIDSPIVRADEHGDAGWTIPADSLGRKGADTLDDVSKARSTAESVRLWVVKNLAGVIDPATVAVVVEPAPKAKGKATGPANVVRLYRKA